MVIIGVLMAVAILVVLCYLVEQTLGLRGAVVMLAASIGVSAYVILMIYFLDQGTTWFT